MGIHIKELRDKILTGKAILFCGAGFSNGAKNIIGEFPPFSKDLSKKISGIVNSSAVPKHPKCL